MGIKIKKAAKKMWISIALTSTIMVIMLIHMFLTPVPGYLFITATLGIPIIFGTGLHVHIGSFKALRNWSPNMDVLVTLGSLPPYLIGLLGFFIPVTTFIEMATTIMTFHLIGKYLEIKAKGRASQAIKKLLEMGAKTAKVIVDGKEIEVPVADLQVGDIMVVRPGEKVPTDGIIIEGSIMIPSVGTFSPGLTTIISPTCRSATGTSISFPSTITFAVLAPISSNFLIACDARPLALISRYLPIKWKVMIVVAISMNVVTGIKNPNKPIKYGGNDPRVTNTSMFGLQFLKALKLPPCPC